MDFTFYFDKQHISELIYMTADSLINPDFSLKQLQKEVSNISSEI